MLSDLEQDTIFKVYILFQAFIVEMKYKRMGSFY